MLRCCGNHRYLIISVLLLIQGSLVISLDRDNNDPHVKCHPVKHVFVNKFGMDERNLPRHPVRGTSQDMCVNRHSCCTITMENELLELSRKDFQVTLKQQSKFLRESLSDHAQDVQDSVILLINISQENMKRKMNEFHPGLQAMLMAEVHNLYDDMRSFLQGRNLEIDLTDSFRNFLDSVFAVLYYRVVWLETGVMSPEYRKCVKNVRQDMHNYGPVLVEVAGNVSRSLEITRAIVQALNLGVEVMNTTDHHIYQEECYFALVRMNYCETCQGIQGFLPCRGFCNNVLRGCLVALTELSTPWKEYITAIESLVHELHHNLYVEPLLADYPTYLVAEMEKIVEQTSKDDKVFKVCGYLLEKGEIIPGETGESIIYEREEEDLKMKLQQLTTLLVESHSHYAYLPDVLCNNDTASSQDNDCWNGRDTAKYEKIVVGHSGQRYNPEVRMERSRSSRSPQISQISDKLRHVRHLLLSKLSTSRDTSSYFMDQGSGSGQYYNQVLDVEAETVYEGSGSGYGPYEGDPLTPGPGVKPSESDIYLDKKASGSGLTTVTTILLATSSVSISWLLK